MSKEEDAAALPEPGRIMRPADIPIYDGGKSDNNVGRLATKREVGALEEGISSVRKAFQSTFMGPFRDFSQEATRIYETGMAHTQCT